MLNCQKATQLFSESQERPLTLKEKMDLKLHTQCAAAVATTGGIFRRCARLPGRMPRGKARRMHCRPKYQKKT